jgi:hypothetical protein
MQVLLPMRWTRQCRREESNRRAMLKSRKLLTLINAKNVFHGYAAVTRSREEDALRTGRNRGYAKTLLRIRRPT